MSVLYTSGNFSASCLAGHLIIESLVWSEKPRIFSSRDDCRDHDLFHGLVGWLTGWPEVDNYSCCSHPGTDGQDARA